MFAYFQLQPNFGEMQIPILCSLLLSSKYWASNRPIRSVPIRTFFYEQHTIRL